MIQIFIDILAFTTLLSSLLVINSKNPVLSIVFLISVFVNAAGYLILTGVNFLGIAYLLIYVGGIVVLFLFVIMLLNINLEEITEVGNQYTKNLPLAFTIAFIFIYEILNIVPFTINDISILSALFNLLNSIFILFSTASSNYYYFNDEVQIAINPIIADSTFVNFTQIESLGHFLYTYSALWLIITSIILLLAMIGPIILHVSKN
jgi:NADH-ubiquinone oxidoreductase chain 6